jgi:hypothetical protein
MAIMRRSGATIGLAALAVQAFGRPARAQASGSAQVQALFERFVAAQKRAQCGSG